MKYQDKIVLPKKDALELVTQMHGWTHLGHKKIKSLIKKSDFYIPGLNSLIQQVMSTCVPCAKVNAGRQNAPEGIRIRGNLPGTHWKMDFTEIKPGKYGNKYLLAFIDTFSGWTEAFPTK